MLVRAKAHYWTPSIIAGISKSNLYGLDYEARAVEGLQKRGFNAIHGRAEDLHLTPNSYEIMAIERVTNPVALLVAQGQPVSYLNTKQILAFGKVALRAHNTYKHDAALIARFCQVHTPPSGNLPIRFSANSSSAHAASSPSKNCASGTAIVSRLD